MGNAVWLLDAIGMILICSNEIIRLFPRRYLHVYFNWLIFKQRNQHLFFRIFSKALLWHLGRCCSKFIDKSDHHWVPFYRQSLNFPWCWGLLFEINLQYLSFRTCLIYFRSCTILSFLWNLWCCGMNFKPYPSWHWVLPIYFIFIRLGLFFLVLWDAWVCLWHFLLILVFPLFFPWLQVSAFFISSFWGFRLSSGV